MTPPTTHKKKHPRAFATIAALALIALLATALLATTQQLHRSAQRTQINHAHAQLRQLLTAGALAAPQVSQLINPATGAPLESWSMILPSQLKTDFTPSLTLKTKFSGAGFIKTVTIIANYQGLTATQALRYGKIPAGWALLKTTTTPFFRPPTMPTPPN